MKLINKPLQVWHYPQIPCEAFKVDVKNEYEAFKIQNVLADQHLWLEKNGFIPDYCNAIDVVMKNGELWESYYNEDENMDWDDVRDELEQNTSIH